MFYVSCLTINSRYNWPIGRLICHWTKIGLCQNKEGQEKISNNVWRKKSTSCFLTYNETLKKDLQLISSLMLSTLSVSLMSGFEARQTSSKLMCSIFGHKLKMLTVVFPSLDVCKKMIIFEIRLHFNFYLNLNIVSWLMFLLQGNLWIFKFRRKTNKKQI